MNVYTPVCFRFLESSVCFSGSDWMCLCCSFRMSSSAAPLTAPQAGLCCVDQAAGPWAISVACIRWKACRDTNCWRVTLLLSQKESPGTSPFDIIPNHHNLCTGLTNQPANVRRGKLSLSSAWAILTPLQLQYPQEQAHHGMSLLKPRFTLNHIFPVRSLPVLKKDSTVGVDRLSVHMPFGSYSSYSSRSPMKIVKISSLWATFALTKPHPVHCTLWH